MKFEYYVMNESFNNGKIEMFNIYYSMFSHNNRNIYIL